MLYKTFLLFFFLTAGWSLEAKPPELKPSDVTSYMSKIMSQHATYKSLTPELAKRTLHLYIDGLDPSKSYFLEPEIHEWLEPSEVVLNEVLEDYKKNKFTVFEQIQEKMAKAILRHRALEKEIDLQNLPKNVKTEELKDIKWAQTVDELRARLTKIRALQFEAISKLSDELKEKSIQRINKYQEKMEQDILTMDSTQKSDQILTDVLKAFSSSLDTHTAYFTPDEATQFMINVQQRLFGIGAQLRDDINGFTVTKIVEGGPAALSKQLKVKDRIIAINGEPVVGMDIMDVVDMIRGQEKTPVTLQIIRVVSEEEENKEEKLNITINRGEVVLKETRYELSEEPFGDGIIAYIRLFSFYQDPESSSAIDVERELKKLMKERNVKGVIFDLRSNSGGMLSQAVAVTGLFIGKGTIVSIKDETGNVQHLRNLESKPVWPGPLIVLVNRASASASEIVAQALQDYNRALIVGDDHTFGKGTFQTFTLNTTSNSAINPLGEYKVTRGRYYTVSGKSPQLTGVIPDIQTPGFLSEMEIGEKFAKYPLNNDEITPNFDDDLSDIPADQRERIKLLYKFDLQKKLNLYGPYIVRLKENSSGRIKNNKNYQSFLKEIQKKERDEEDENMDKFGQNDLQLTEAYNIMKDLIQLETTKP